MESIFLSVQKRINPFGFFIKPNYVDEWYVTEINSGEIKCGIVHVSFDKLDLNFVVNFGLWMARRSEV